jgi:hypothetical protein
VPFVIEGETPRGDYFVVEDIESFDDLREWMDYFDDLDIDYDWDYDGGE